MIREIKIIRGTKMIREIKIIKETQIIREIKMIRDTKIFREIKMIRGAKTIREIKMIRENKNDQGDKNVLRDKNDQRDKNEAMLGLDFIIPDISSYFRAGQGWGCPKPWWGPKNRFSTPRALIPESPGAEGAASRSSFLLVWRCKITKNPRGGERCEWSSAGIVGGVWRRGIKGEEDPGGMGGGWVGLGLGGLGSGMVQKWGKLGGKGKIKAKMKKKL